MATESTVGGMNQEAYNLGIMMILAEIERYIAEIQRGEAVILDYNFDFEDADTVRMSFKVRSVQR